MIRRCRHHDVVIGKEKSRAMSGKVYLPVVPYLHYTTLRPTMSASTSNTTNPSSSASSDVDNIPEDLDLFVKELMDNMVRN